MAHGSWFMVHSLVNDYSVIKDFQIYRPFQPVAQLSQVIEMGERIGELIVKGLRRGGNVTEPTSVQIQTGSIGEAVTLLSMIRDWVFSLKPLIRLKFYFHDV